MLGSSKEEGMHDESQELAVGGTADYSAGKTDVTVQVGTKRLSVVEKVGFSLGDAASNIYFQTLISFDRFRRLCERVR